MRAGVVRAEGTVVTTVNSSDKILIQQLQTTGSVAGQYLPKEITYQNFITGGGTGLASTTVPYINSSGDFASDSANFFYTIGSNLLTANNLSVGSSGHAGTFKVFQGTASKGFLALAAVANTGNTGTTISNAAMGQATTVSIPDPGATTANFVLDAGTQTIGGAKTFSIPPIGVAQAIQVYLSPITAQAGAVSVLFMAPYAGTVTSIGAAVGGAFTSTNIVITPSIYTAVGTGSTITGGAVTLNTASSGIATSASVTPSAANTFVSGNVITATVTGGVGTVPGVITLCITRTA